MSELPFPDPPLASDRLVLRRWRDDDVPAIVVACQDPLIARFTTVPSPYTQGDARDFLTSGERDRQAGTGIVFAIADPHDGRPLGALSLFGISREHLRATIGYWVDPAARGRGIATDALRLVSGWAFQTLGLRRLELTTDPHNAASQTVATRCGFQREGLMRSHWKAVGGRRDSVIYGLLPEDLAG